MMNLKLNSKYFIVPITLSLLILIVSVLPLPKLPEIKFVASDKIGHMFAFCVLLMTYLWAFSKQNEEGFSYKKSSMISFIICLFIGGLSELLQHFLPIMRYGDWYDFYFDIAGILLGMILFRIAMNTKYFAIILFFFISNIGVSQGVVSSLEFQTELNREFADPEESPLDSVDREHFEGLDFYPIDEKYIVEASLVRHNSPLFFTLETTTSRRPEYRVWGIASFTLNGVECSLTIYQSKKLMNTIDYGDYLFLPYTDLSNGKTTYYGGRYVDLRIVEGDVIIIDFNKSYNPYCAYSDRFSCPKVPAENTLNVLVEAGVKKFH